MNVHLTEHDMPQVRAATRWASRDRRLVLYCISLVLDCIAIFSAYEAIAQWHGSEWMAIGSYPVVLVALPIFVMFAIAREVQSVEALSNSWEGFGRALGALGAMALGVVMLTFLSKEDHLSRLGLAQFFVMSAVGLGVSKLVLHRLVNSVLSGRVTSHLLLLDGFETEAAPGMDSVDVAALGLWPDLTRPDYIDALSRIVTQYDRVVVACVPERRDAWALFLKASDVGGEIMLDRDSLHGAVAIGTCGNDDTLILSRGPLSGINRVKKRTLDLVVGIPLLVLLSPMMALVAIAIRIDSPGPVFFNQIRVGQGNRQFLIFKFRSMRVDSGDSNGARSASRNDDRITRVGRIIRRMSIDELPQLLNVMKGDMSLVGPRPHALGSLAGGDLFWEVTTSYWLRHALRPGITGLAQVRGLRGATHSPEDLTLRLRADLEYVTRWTVSRDIVILLRTLAVMAHKNAY